MATFTRLRGKAGGESHWPVFELRGHPHYDPDQRECRCFFAMARPYPSRNTAMYGLFSLAFVARPAYTNTFHLSRPLFAPRSVCCQKSDRVNVAQARLFSRAQNRERTSPAAPTRSSTPSVVVPTASISQWGTNLERSQRQR